MAPVLMWLMRVNGGSPSGKEEPPSLNSECFEGKHTDRLEEGQPAKNETVLLGQPFGGGTTGRVSSGDLELILSQRVSGSSSRG